MFNSAGKGPTLYGAGTVDGRDSERRCGVRWPSDRAVSGVLQWIDEAEASGRTWARNALVVIGLLLAVLWLALKTGLIGG